MSDSENKPALSLQLFPIAADCLDDVVKTSITRYTHGFCAGIPMACPGRDGCPYRETCTVDKPKRGKKCPIEIGMVAYTFTAIASELSVQPDEVLILHKIKLLTDAFVMYERASRSMVTGSFETPKIAGYNEATGEELINMEISNAVQLQELMFNRIMKLSKELGSSGNSIHNHLHLHGRNNIDYASHASRLRETISVEQRKKLGIDN